MSAATLDCIFPAKPGEQSSVDLVGGPRGLGGKKKKIRYRNAQCRNEERHGETFLTPTKITRNSVSQLRESAANIDKRLLLGKMRLAIKPAHNLFDLPRY